MLLCGASNAPSVRPPALNQIGSGANNAFQFADTRDWSDARIAAQNANDPALVKLITWRYLLDGDSGANFEEISGFMKMNPDWPEQKKLRIRAELALRDAHLNAGDVINWFGDDEPVTGMGKLLLGEALLQQSSDSQKATNLIRAAWRNGDFDEAQQNSIIAAHGDMLRAEDDIARIDRMLWEEKIIEAKRMITRVPVPYQKLYKARMALMANKKLSLIALAEVDKKLKQNPGLIYDRMRYRARHDDSGGVRDMLLAAPATVPFPEKWWSYRELQVRKAVDEGKYALAEKLIAHHSQIEGTNLADAKFLSGWIQLEFLNHPKEAYDIFSHMYDSVKFPVSRARAAYWAARAAEKSGDSAAAGNWYNTASAWPTTFYGQLAALKAFGTAPLHIPAEPEIGSDTVANFENNDIVRAVKLCAENSEPDLANKLISYLIEDADNDDQIILAANLGTEIGRPYLSVRGAKKAFQHNIVVVDASYPNSAPQGLPIEHALALAVVRQESEFDPSAHSPSGALGMMQLLPGTAKETAHKLGMDYNKGQLSSPDYNITLGSHYLGRLIEGYSGSYIMAIAAYNAGPGNVHNWAEEFGTPGNDAENAVDWIEKIPFVETRNYVERVLENLQVYRHLEAGSDSPKLKLEEDLTR